MLKLVPERYHKGFLLIRDRHAVCNSHRSFLEELVLSNQRIVAGYVYNIGIVSQEDRRSQDLTKDIPSRCSMTVILSNFFRDSKASYRYAISKWFGRSNNCSTTRLSSFLMFRNCCTIWNAEDHLMSFPQSAQ